MPSVPPYAKALVQINGGGNQSGGVEPVASAATVQLVPESTIGWTQAKWEWVDYPEGWTAPAGWSTDATGIVYATTLGNPPSFQLPAAGITWGKWSLRLRVNEQVNQDVNPLSSLVDESLVLSMYSPNNLLDVSAKEDTQFTTTSTAHKKWVRSLQRILRILDPLLVGGGGNTISSVGTGVSLVSGKVGADLQIFSIIAGANITITPSGSGVTIASTGGGGSGEANTASNLGAGVGVFSAKVGVDLRFNSLVAGSNVTLTPGTGIITIAATGEANTASNLGSGVGIFASKSGVDLRFLSLVAGTNITLTPSGTTITIDATAGAGGPPTGSAGGDLSGTYPNPTVAKVKGTTITTAGGSLTTGTVLRVTGVGTADWGALDLANSNAIVNLLPAASQSPQTMSGDVTGTTAASVVSKVRGATISTAGGSLTIGNVLKVTGVSTLDYGPVNLAGGAGHVTGALPLANLTLGSANQFLRMNGAGTAAVWTTFSASSSGAINTVQTSDGSGGFLGATNVLAGSGFISIGATPSGAGLVRSAYNAGSAIALWSVKDSTGTDRSILTFGAGDAWGLGNGVMDCTITSATTGVISFTGGSSNIQLGTGSMATTGYVRFGYNGGAAKSLVAVLSSLSTSVNIIGFGPGDALQYGNTTMDTTVSGVTFVLNATSTGSIQKSGSEVIGWDVNHITFSKPRHGNASPWCDDGFVQIDTTSGRALTSSEYTRKLWSFGPNTGGTFTIPVASDLDHSYMFCVGAVSPIGTFGAPITLSDGTHTVTLTRDAVVRTYMCTSSGFLTIT